MYIYLEIVLTKAEPIDPYLGAQEEYFGQGHRLRVIFGKAVINHFEILEDSIKCSGEEGGFSRDLHLRELRWALNLES